MIYNSNLFNLLQMCIHSHDHSLRLCQHEICAITERFLHVHWEAQVHFSNARTYVVSHPKKHSRPTSKISEEISEESVHLTYP